MKYLLVVTAFLILCSCQKKNSDIQATDAPRDQQQQDAPPPGPAPTPPPAEPAPPAPVLPGMAFGFDEYTYDGTHNIFVELTLSAPSEVPVTVDVELVDGTALFDRDYSGFVGGGNSQKRTVVFAPKQTKIDLPAIFIKNEAVCGSVFTALLTGAQHAKITKDSAQIFLNCD